MARECLINLFGTSMPHVLAIACCGPVLSEAQTSDLYECGKRRYTSDPSR